MARPRRSAQVAPMNPPLVIEYPAAHRLVSGSNAWKVRYAPAEIGTYTYSVTKKDSGGTVTLGTGSFSCVASSNPGFIKAVGFHLEFANGQPFYPLGINAPWFQYKTNG